MLLFYKIVNKEAPDFLYELVPPLVEASVNYNLRSHHNIYVPFNRLSVFQISYFPCTIKEWNSLDLIIRNLPTFSSFKLKLQQIFYTMRRNPQYYSIGDRFLSVLHSRMRNKCSALHADWYHANLIVNYNCLCGYFNENAEHYLLHCNRFTCSRMIMLLEINKLNLIGIPVNIDLLLFGVSSNTGFQYNTYSYNIFPYCT